MYYDKDADLQILENKTIEIIGYGNQGHAQAQNLRDSGLKVIIGELKDIPNWKKAVKDGFTVKSAAEVAKEAEIIQVLIPDEYQAQMYQEDISSSLKKRNALVFSHGFNIHFHQIIPPDWIDVFMIAPKGPGVLVRRTYLEGKGVPCLIAVHQDASGSAKQLALAYAKGIGGTRAGVMETTFREETETDLFGEQTVLCGGVTALIKAGFKTLVEAGYQPEMAYFECLHELKLIVDLIQESGLTGMRAAISNTAEYGDLTRGSRVIGEETRKEMRKILQEIQSGVFAREWILENQVNRPVFNALVKKDQSHPVEVVGRELREMMSWINQKK